MKNKLLISGAASRGRYCFGFVRRRRLTENPALRLNARTVRRRQSISNPAANKRERLEHLARRARH